MFQLILLSCLLLLINLSILRIASYGAIASHREI